MKIHHVPIDEIIIPDYVERAGDRVEDDLLLKSVARGGIQQPFVVVTPPDGRKLLADGLTRLRIARALSFSTVPCLFDRPADDETDFDRYVKRVRFLVNFQRQDLLPSQKAEFIQYFKNPPWNMTHREITQFLGLKPDTVTNLLAPKTYIPVVAAALDAGHITRHAARVFDGLSEKGQETIWEKHHEELVSTAGGVVHAQLRKKYSPKEHPEFYRQPKLIEQRLRRAAQKRRGNIRPDMSGQERVRLVSSLSFEQSELKMCQAEEQRYDRRRNASIRAVRVMLRNPELKDMLSPDMILQLEKWHSIYC